ncbi:MAG: VWA domain-containing protein [Acidimicrobiia bacterium]|nr:VWA domain-containing protein [Acidimicrobiia bacterium]
MNLLLTAVVALAAFTPLAAATRVLVTVVESRTYQPVAGLQAPDFDVQDGGSPRHVEMAEFASLPVDVALLVDSSLAGHMVQPVAADMIAQLRDKEQMALISFDSSANLAQDFTSSRNALLEALASLKFGNDPRVLDALYATMDEAFRNATLRRVVLLLTSGLEGNSRVGERSVIQLARKNGVSIYPLYALGYERGLFESLARQTGGVPISIRNIGRETKSPAERVFEIVRGHYTLTLRGNLAVSDKLKIQLRRPGKYVISFLPLD